MALTVTKTKTFRKMLTVLKHRVSIWYYYIDYYSTIGKYAWYIMLRSD